MTHDELDLMTELVEDTTAHLVERGFVRSNRAEFLVSRLLEYGMRGYSTAQVAELVSSSIRALEDECHRESLPTPWVVMDCGMALIVARICMEGCQLAHTAMRLGYKPLRAGSSMERTFGVRYRGLEGKTWGWLMEEMVDRRWSGEEGREAVA